MSDRSPSFLTAKRLLLASCLFFIAGCITPRVDYDELSRPLDADLPVVSSSADQAAMLIPFSKALGEWDWVKLTSGEWLKGEVSSLTRETLEFESDELGDLKLDWEKVAELITGKFYTLHLVDRTTIVGVPYVSGDRISLRGPTHEEVFHREAVMGFIRGRPTEANYWSGHVRFGATLQAGNVDSIDTAFTADARRRTADSRLSAALNWVQGTIEGTETVDNQTLTGAYDLFVTPRIYITPLGVELFRDSIQNIALRAAPYTGVGYYLVDESDTDWELSVGLGYRYTEFDSVPVGEEDSDETATGVIESKYHKDITSDVELDLTYKTEIGLEDTEETNQQASLLLTFDFVWDLDFTLNINWKRVGKPEQNEDGETPENDDLRVELGLSWEF